jgi:hypothetical protein
MRTLFGVLLLVHAVAHQLAFASSIGLAPRMLPRVLHERADAFDTGQLGSLLLGLSWASLGAGLLVAAIATFAALGWAATFSAVVLLSSLGLAIVEWPVCSAARLGVVANAGLLAMLWGSHALDVLF